MTVTSETSQVEYISDGVTLDFPIDYYFLEETHIKVTVSDPAGTIYPVDLDIDYTISGAGNPSGGSLHFVVERPLGYSILIARNVPATQLTNYQPNDDFPAESHERALDKLTMLIQQVNVSASSGSTTVIALNSVTDIATAKQDEKLLYLLKGYHAGSSAGGDEIYWAPNIPKSQHNGGTIWSPTVPWDGSLSGLRNYLAGVGETAPGTNGCFLRKVKPFYLITDFGAVADWNDTTKTGYDNKWVIEKCVKTVQSTCIPGGAGEFATGAAGSAFIQGFSNKIICGPGKLHKTGPAGIFSFNNCDSISVYKVKADGNLAWDEANFGTILNNSRAPTNYSFFASFSSCNNSRAIECEIDSFSWDGIVATGVVAPGGLTATQMVNVKFDNNKVSNVRGSMLWMKAVKTFSMSNNNLKNTDGFIQKANAVYAVEWCHDGKILNNEMFFIGDNAIGVGELLNHVQAAVNKDIKIAFNNSDMNRYHAILIAQGQDIDVCFNTVERAGAKDNMPGVNNAVLCGAIAVKGGDASAGVAVFNKNVRVRFNTIINPYEFGIYGYDDASTTTNYVSDQISFVGNTITGHGTLPLSTRIDSGGIRTQYLKAQDIDKNTITDGIGDGVRCFGDARATWNIIQRITGKGMHFPSDTILNNTKLTTSPSHNVVEDCSSTGIAIWGKSFVAPAYNQIRRNGNVTLGETSTDAYDLSGISTWGCTRAEFIGNECELNGGAGIFANLSQRVDVSGGYVENNGLHMTTANFRSGVYASGTNGSNLVDFTAMMAQARTGTNQQYAFRVLFGNPTQSVAVDCKIDGHPLGILGATVKSLFNIP